MVLTNYKAKNNASTTLASGISAGATSMIVATGAGALFPSTYPFLMTLEQFTGDNVTKREIVKCTSRTGDTFTIVRSAWYCPADYTALTQTNTAFAFSTGDTVSLRIVSEIVDDINAELARLETDKLNLTGGSMTGAILQAQSSDIASATTTDLSTMTGDSGKITWTTTITWFWTVQAGTIKHITFTWILTLTHNATSLILPNAGSNITTADGDSMVIKSLWSGNWKCLAYQRANGTALVASTPGSATTSAQGIVELATDAETQAGTDTSRAVVPSSLTLVTTVPEQVIPVKVSANTGYASNLNCGGTTDGSVIFCVTYHSTTTLEIFRLVKETKTWQYIITHATTLACTSLSNRPSCCVAWSYVYVIFNDNSTGEMWRYAVADLSWVTAMTISGTAIWTSCSVAFSNGTDIYISTSSDGVMRKYTISGTTATYSTDVTYTSAWVLANWWACTDGTSVWTVVSANGSNTIYKYPIAWGASTANVTRFFYLNAYNNVSKLWLTIWKAGTLNVHFGHTMESNTAVVASAVKLCAINQP